MYDSHTSYAKTVQASNCGQTTFSDVGTEQSIPESGTDIVLNIKRISVQGSKYNVDFSYLARSDHSTARRLVSMKVILFDGTEIPGGTMSAGPHTLRAGNFTMNDSRSVLLQKATGMQKPLTALQRA